MAQTQKSFTKVFCLHSLSSQYYSCTLFLQNGFHIIRIFHTIMGEVSNPELEPRVSDAFRGAGPDCQTSVFSFSRPELIESDVKVYLGPGPNNHHCFIRITQL